MKVGEFDPGMPEIVSLYRVFMASPGDVIEERAVVEEVLKEWNLQHGNDAKARVELVSWHTHSYPSTGDRPQALINKQALNASDIVVGFFWSRFGSPTGVAESGTEEEIREGIAQKKPVMVYFSKRKSVTKQKTTERMKIEKFKADFGRQALFWEYSEVSGFEKAFRNHLASVMSSLLNHPLPKQK